MKMKHEMPDLIGTMNFVPLHCSLYPTKQLISCHPTNSIKTLTGHFGTLVGRRQ